MIKMISVLVFDTFYTDQNLEPLLKKVDDDDYLYDGVIYRLLHLQADDYEWGKNYLRLNNYYPASQKVIDDYIFESVEETKETLQKIVNHSRVLVHYSKEFLEKYLKRYNITYDCEIKDVYSLHAKKPRDLVSIAGLMQYYFGEYYQKYTLQNNIYLRLFCVLRLFAKTHDYEIDNISEFYKQIFRHCEKYHQLKKFIYKEQLSEFYETTRYNGMLSLTKDKLLKNIENEHYEAYKQSCYERDNFTIE